ncbi:hypothetical protein [Salipaludibacillus sp. CF4.18]|uniref:hypothetical protein n=1 Tax=Salipaludibacillus sp. CF4.18 TaxID=3373081 RepID=UPI003EE77254
MPKREQVCLSVSKIYDWTKHNVTKDFHFNGNNLEFYLEENTSSHDKPINPCTFFDPGELVEVNCMFLDLACSETGSRTDRCGKNLNTTLQSVKIKKTGSFQVVLTGLEGQLFSREVKFAVAENVQVCAPEETKVVCEVDNQSCSGCFFSAGGDWSIDLTLFFCQSIYVQLDTALAICASLANPRKNFIAQELRCNPIGPPPQNPSIFPSSK